MKYRQNKISKIIGRLLLISVIVIAIVVSGCLDSGGLYEGNPVAIGDVGALSSNWDSDADDDGYNIWFTLVNSNNEMISANGKVYYGLKNRDYDVDLEVIKTNPIPVSSNDFEKRKIGMGAFERTLLVYVGRFPTEYTGYKYTVYVHFITEDGNELVGKD